MKPPKAWPWGGPSLSGETPPPLRVRGKPEDPEAWVWVLGCPAGPEARLEQRGQRPHLPFPPGPVLAPGFLVQPSTMEVYLSCLSGRRASRGQTCEFSAVRRTWLISASKAGCWRAQPGSTAGDRCPGCGSLPGWLANLGEPAERVISYPKQGRVGAFLGSWQGLRRT